MQQQVKSSVPHEQLVESIRRIVPVLDCEWTHMSAQQQQQKQWSLSYKHSVCSHSLQQLSTLTAPGMRIRTEQG